MIARRDPILSVAPILRMHGDPPTRLFPSPPTHLFRPSVRPSGLRLATRLERPENKPTSTRDRTSSRQFILDTLLDHTDKPSKDIKQIILRYRNLYFFEKKHLSEYGSFTLTSASRVWTCQDEEVPAREDAQPARLRLLHPQPQGGQDQGRQRRVKRAQASHHHHQVKIAPELNTHL